MTIQTAPLLTPAQLDGDQGLIDEMMAMPKSPEELAELIAWQRHVDKCWGLLGKAVMEEHFGASALPPSIQDGHIGRGRTLVP